ncbi:transposase [Streptomyces sp. P9(2023)]|uniref:transposase n=1 Tax=Streptomyces sp. P9(2023) TaxID=3064394 RepID=UPI0028F3FE2D|nr:transposase [Streptomyces sp. P9(2023)]MDT9691307.1 transposase [Streptomyces sp. P9(2023)]
MDLRDFLDEIDRQTGEGLTVHVICDNLSAHKAPVGHKRLLADPRFQLHFTPTYSSWINQIERWLRAGTTLLRAWATGRREAEHSARSRPT